MSNLNSLMDFLYGYPNGSALEASFRVSTGTLTEGDVVKVESGSPAATATGTTILDPATAPPADIDVFVDPHANADFVTAAITDDHLLDSAYNANADMVTVPVGGTIFDAFAVAPAVAYAGAKTLRGVIGKKRLRTTAADAFTTARIAQGLSYAVRPALLKSEDPASAYLTADVDGITWANASAIFDTFTDPAAGVDFIAGAVAAGDIFDTAHNAVPDWVTIGANEHIFMSNATPYGGGHVVHATNGVISARRLRTTAATAFAAAHAADALSWFVRAPVLLAEDPASPYSQAVGGTVDAITWGPDGGGLTRITGAGAAEFAACLVGDVAHVTGGATAAHNSGWRIVNVDVAFNYVDINLAFGADANSGVAGFGVAVYRPDVSGGLATVQVAQTITAAGAGGFAGVAVGDMAVVLFSGGTPGNIGTWRVSAIDVTDTIATVTSPAGFALANELAGLTDVVFFHVRESNVATAATVGDRGLTRITGTVGTEFAACTQGQIAAVSGGDAATDAHNAGWVIHAVGALGVSIDIELAFTADANSGTPGFQVQTYSPTIGIWGMTAALGTQRLTRTGACAAVAIGDIAVITDTANKGMWYVSAKTADTVTLEAPAGYGIVDEAVGLANVAFFRPTASRGAASVTVRKRLTRLVDTGAAFKTAGVQADVDYIVMPWEPSVDPLHWDTLTTRWPVETVVSETTLDATLTALQELGPEDFVAGYAANAPYRIDIAHDQAVVSKLTSATAQHTDGSLNVADYPWFVIEGNDQTDAQAAAFVTCLRCKSGVVMKIPFAAANTVDPGNFLYANAGALTLVTNAAHAIGGSGAFYNDYRQPVCMVLETNRTAGATGYVIVVTC